MKKLKKKIPVIIEKTDTGYSAYSEVNNVFTTASDIPELHVNLTEALNLFYEDTGYYAKADNLRTN